jgi:hypothetical protein
MKVLFAATLMALCAASCLSAQSIGCPDQLCIRPYIFYRGAVTQSKCLACGPGSGSACSAGFSPCASTCQVTACDDWPVIGEPDAVKCPARPTAIGQQITKLDPIAGFASKLHDGAPGDPARLVSISTDMAHDEFAGGTLRNRGTQDIKAYRMGWLLYERGGAAPAEHEGPLMNVPAGIEPGALYKVPAQGVKPILDTKHSQIVFYLAQVILEDGTEWQPDLKSIKVKFKPGPDPPLPTAPIQRPGTIPLPPAPNQ